MRPHLDAGLLAGCLCALIAGCARPAPPLAPQQAERQPEPAKENPAPPEPVEEGWTDATKASATVGDLELRVTGARIGKARLTQAFTEGEFPQPNDDLIIYLRLKNRSQTQKIQHNGWSMQSFPPRVPKLTDDHGTSCQHHPSIGSAVDGVRVWVGSIDPAKETDDIVLFQVPPANATRLKLELAAPADTGTFGFIIPMSLVKRGG